MFVANEEGNREDERIRRESELVAMLARIEERLIALEGRLGDRA